LGSSHGAFFDFFAFFATAIPPSKNGNGGIEPGFRLLGFQQLYVGFRLPRQE
jgi:hypothetical protein